MRTGSSSLVLRFDSLFRWVLGIHICLRTRVLGSMVLMRIPVLFHWMVGCDL
jgi:hypothetical protein